MQLFHFLVDSRYQTIRLRLAWVIYAAVLVLGSIPGARQEVGMVASGLVLHFCTYACIATLLFTGASGTPAMRALRACLLIAVMGAVDEFVQSFLPYRTADISDWYVDVSAGLFASLTLWRLFPRWQAALAVRSSR